MNLGTIRTLARQKADEELTTYISNAELDSYINEGYHFAYNAIVERFENYFITKGTALNGGLIITVAGTQMYAFPTDLFKLVRVEMRNSGNTDENAWVPLTEDNIGNDGIRNPYPLSVNYITGNNFSSGLSFFVAGNSLGLRPVPAAAFDLRLWYVPYATELALDADVPAIPLPYHRLIAEYGAIQCLAKSGEGLWRERSETFRVQVDAMLQTIGSRTQGAEQMLITESFQTDPSGWTVP